MREALLLLVLAILVQYCSADLLGVYPPGTCFEKFDTCKLEFLKGGTCTSTSAKCRNGLGPAIDGFGRVATTLSTPLISHMNKTRLDNNWTSPFIGFLNRLQIKKLVQSFVPALPLDSTGARICSTVTVPLYSASGAATVSSDCAKLSLPSDGRYVVAANRAAIPGRPACVAVDPCTATFFFTSLGQPLIVYNADVYDPETIVKCKVAVSDVEFASLSLFGHVVAQSSIPLWSMVGGGTGSFASVIASGHVRLVANASITVAVLHVSLTLNTKLNVLVNFDDLRDGIIGGAPDHKYFIQSSQAGPIIRVRSLFQNGSVNLGVDHGSIDMTTSSSVNSTISWFCHGPSDFLLQAQFDGGLDLAGVLSGIMYPWQAAIQLLSNISNIPVTLAVFVNPKLWGMYITLKSNVDLPPLSQKILDTIGFPQGPGSPPFPSSLSSGAALVFTGAPDVMGIKVSVVLSDDSGSSSALFSVNFCTTDSNCVDDGYICVIDPSIDDIGACQPAPPPAP